MNDLDLAYIAGLIDGEGYVGIKKTTTKRNGRVNPQYQERIQVRMVNEGAIRFLADTLGGKYYKESPSVAKGRPLYCYQASDLQAVSILTAVLPYLRVKKENALAVLGLRDRKKNPHKIAVIKTFKNRWGVDTDFRRWRHSPIEIEARERLYQRCKTLNKTGV